MATDKHIQNLHGPRGTSHAVPGGPAARRTLGLTMAAGVAGAIVGVFGAGPAVADSVPLTLRYTCSVGNYAWPGQAEIDSDVPKSATVGKPTPKFVIRAAVPVSAADTNRLRRVGVQTITGTVDAKVRVVAPEGDRDITVPLQVARTNVPASGPFLVKMAGIAPTRTFDQPGRARITVRGLMAHVTVSGVVNGEFTVPCRLNARQNTVVASFEITGTRTATGLSPSGVTDMSASGTTRSQIPHHGAGVGTTTQDSSGPAGSLPTTGSQGVRSLIMLAAGTFALGTIAVAAAFRLRSRGR